MANQVKVFKQEIAEIERIKSSLQEKSIECEFLDNSKVNDWIFTAGDFAFKCSSTTNCWFVKSSSEKNFLESNFISEVKPGDRIWFVRKSNGLILGLATFVENQKDLLPSIREKLGPNFDAKKYVMFIHYTNFLNLEKHNYMVKIQVPEVQKPLEEKIQVPEVQKIQTPEVKKPTIEKSEAPKISRSSSPIDWIVRVGDGTDFKQFSIHNVLGIDSKTSTIYNGQEKIKIDSWTVKTGDRLWFLKKQSNGRILAVATFEKMENGCQIQSALSKGWDRFIYYNELYNLEECQISVEIKNPANIIRYENGSTNLALEYEEILIFSKMKRL